jgi:hypothetical protein
MQGALHSHWEDNTSAAPRLVLMFVLFWSAGWLASGVHPRVPAGQRAVQQRA